MQEKMSRLAIPDWMRQTEGSAVSADLGRTAPGVSFARKALSSFSSLIADMVTQKDSAMRRGYLQPLDARVKTVVIVALVVAMTLVHSWGSLLLGYAVCLVLAAASRLPAKRVLKVWLAVPLFTLAFMLPATLNVVTDGDPLWVVWRSAPLGFLPPRLAVTVQGVEIAGKMMLRTADCVTLALLLAYTTRTDRLFRGLRALFVPSLFVTVLIVMDRYLSVIAKVAEEIHMAKLSRSIRSRGLRAEHEWVAAGIGSLFRRTQSLGHQVYLAMLSRGFTGEALVIDDMRLKPADYSLVAISALIVATLLFLR